tara:strand:+ start:2657 stop:3124 length:468 start_codon:yes stop_codon:yes gene_type:complete
MNIVISPNDLKLRNIYFHDAVTNTVMDDSSFIRVGYSNTDVTLNGIYLDISLNVSRIDKYFHKYKYIFEYTNNMECIDLLVRIERMILDNLPATSTRNVYKLKEQFLHNSIRVFENIDSPPKSLTPGIYNFTLKISGIWVTDSDCGLTFKFFSQN